MAFVARAVLVVRFYHTVLFTTAPFGTRSDEWARSTAFFSPSKVDYELKASLEKLVTKWSSQIQEVLVRDSGSELDAGNHPTPMSGEILVHVPPPRNTAEMNNLELDHHFYTYILVTHPACGPR
jgi:hypothetical protein